MIDGKMFGALGYLECCLGFANFFVVIVAQDCFAWALTVSFARLFLRNVCNNLTPMVLLSFIGYLRSWML